MKPIPRLGGVAKRLFDILASALGLLLLSPFFGVIAWAIKRDSPGPVFYRGRRAGWGDREFHILKFRSMLECPQSYQDPPVTGEAEPRVTLLVRWLPVLLWAVVIFIASAKSNPYQALPASWAEPVSPSTLGKPNRDELLGRFLHAGEYAVLAALTARALVWHSKLRFSLLVATLGLAALYALSDEIHQLFVPGRSFELRDLALDITGAAVGLAGYALIRAFWQIRAGKAPHG